MHPTVCLTFSTVDNTDLIILLKVLSIPTDKLEVRENLIGRNILELTLEDVTLRTRPSVLKTLAKLTPKAQSLLGEGEVERAMIQQWLDFASETVLGEVRETRSIETTVYAVLHEQLARSTFIAGGTSPSIADWALFSLLFPRIKAMVASVGAKYYRLIRWTGYLQHLMLSQTSTVRVEVGTNGDKEVEAFVPAVFDFGKLRAALDGVADTVGPEKSSAKPPTKTKKESTETTAKTTSTPASHPLARVDLRVGKIVKVEKHPNADRLYVEHVDVGEAEPRVVVSGLVEHVPIEALQDRLCVFICNLKPATLCKVLSSAMLLVAKQPEGEGNVLEPLTPPSGATAGDRITIDGVAPQPDAMIKPKEATWETVRVLLKMENGVATYEGAPLVVPGKGSITSSKVLAGIIS